MAESLERGAVSDVHQPFARDRLLHDCIPCQQLDQRRSRPQPRNDVCREHGRFNCRERRDGMIHVVQRERSDVAQIPRQHERGDLPSAIRQQSIAAGEALDDEKEALHRQALLREIFARLEMPHGRGDRIENPFVLGREGYPVLQSSNEALSLPAGHCASRRVVISSRTCRTRSRASTGFCRHGACRRCCGTNDES